MNDDLLIRLLDHRLGSDEAAEAFAVLVGDSDERRHLDEQVAVEELLRALLSPAPERFVAGVVRRTHRLRSTSRFIRSVQRSARRARRPRIGTRIAWGIAAAAALVVGVVLWSVHVHAPAAVLRLVQTGGGTLRHVGGAAEPLAAGMTIRDGDEVEASSPFAIARDDGASLRSAAGARLRVSDARRIRLDQGSLRVEVPHPPGVSRELLTVATAAGEVHVTGTCFLVSVHGDRTALVMEDGTTRFVNSAGEATVSAPRCARAQAGSAPLVVDPLPARLVVEFHDRTLPVDPGDLLDDGDEYAAGRGYGWTGPKLGPPLPGNTWLSSKGPRRVFAGRFTTNEDDLPDPERPYLSTGWAEHVETWMMDVPDGRYRVTVRVGDAKSAQGPNHVRIQDVQVVDRVLTREGELTERSATVTVDDGRLTMRVGGGGPGPDGTSDTVLARLAIERIE